MRHADFNRRRAEVQPIRANARYPGPDARKRAILAAIRPTARRLPLRARSGQRSNVDRRSARCSRPRFCRFAHRGRTGVGLRRDVRRGRRHRRIRGWMRDRGEVLDIAKNRCPGANASGFGRRAPLVARGIAASGPHVPRLPAQRAVASCGSTPRHVTSCHAFRLVSFAGASHRFAGAGRFVERRLRAICIRRQAAPFRAPFSPPSAGHPVDRRRRPVLSPSPTRRRSHEPRAPRSAGHAVAFGRRPASARGRRPRRPRADARQRPPR